MRFLLIIVLLICTSLANAQFNQNTGHVWVKYSHGVIDSAQYNNFSASGEYLVNEYIGLNYNFDLSFRTDNVFQFHSSIGALAGPPLIVYGLLSSSTNNGQFNLGGLGTVLGILILIAPDGVSFHIPIGYNYDISPYANVIGCDIIRDRNIQKTYFKYAASFGVKGTFWQSNGFTLNTFVETRKVASLAWSFGGGFGIGYSWGD